MDAIRISAASPPPETWVVVWRVTEACSLACRFCGYSRELVRSRESADVGQMLAWGRVLAAFQQRYQISVLVSWLGGEPLSWPELPRLGSRFHREFGLRLGTTTNGLPLASATVRRSLLANYEQLTVSIDGCGKFHDDVRGIRGLYDHLREQIARLQRERDGGRLLLRVNTVLMRDNVADFESFAVEMARWGFSELTFNQLGGNERPEFHASHRLLPSQLQSFISELPTVRERVQALGMRILGTDRYLHRLACSAAGQPIAVEDCSPGVRFLFVNERGVVSPCSFTSDRYGIPLEELDSPEALRELPIRFAMLRRAQRHVACHDCHATHVFDKFRPDKFMPGEPCERTAHARQISATDLGSTDKATCLAGTA